MTTTEGKLCGHPGCDLPGSPVFMVDDSDVPWDYYCGEHAFRHGFCSTCGMFNAGIESFEFGDGRCDNCRLSDWRQYA